MGEHEKKPTRFPQVLALTGVTRSGKISVTKPVRCHLGLDGPKPLYLESKGEYVLCAAKHKGAEKLDVHKNGVRLPERVLDALGIRKGGSVALVERSGKVAVKAFSTDKKEGNEAR